MSETKRINWIDMAKGYGMLLVIYAHLGVGGVEKWIYTFHMPLFFFLSGYVFSTKYGFLEFLKKKMKTIIVPYVALGIPMVAFMCWMETWYGRLSENTVKMLVVQFLVQKRFATLWFIACLFWTSILFYWIVKLAKTMMRIFVIVLLMILAGLAYYHYGGSPLPWNIDVCLTAMPFFFVGYFCKNRYDDMKAYLQGKKSILYFVALAIVNVVAGYMGICIAGKGLEMFYSSYGCPPLVYLSAFAGIGCVVILSHWLCIPFVRYIGENTMLYYTWHQAIMIPLVRMGAYMLGMSYRENWATATKLGYRLIELIVIVLVLTLCNLLISKTKLRFMIGK